MTIYDSKSDYYSENEDWCVGMRARIYRLLVDINYLGTETTDAFPLESFNMTIEKTPDIPQHINSR